MLHAIKKFLNKKKRGGNLKSRCPQYAIGRWTYGNPKIVSWGRQADLTIGSFCSFAGGITIFLGGEHRTDWVTTYPFTEKWTAAKHILGHPGTKGNVVIGNDVWVGAGALILSGVTIGSGAVIGARAVITKDVPPYGIAAGNPAQIISIRFDDQVIERLLKIAWWDWEDRKIERFLPFLLNTDIQKFLIEAERETPQ